MKVKNLLPILFNSEWVRICEADEGVYWSGYVKSIPKKYYNYTINKLSSFPYEYSDSCMDIFIKQKGVK